MTLKDTRSQATINHQTWSSEPWPHIVTLRGKAFRDLEKRFWDTWHTWGLHQLLHCFLFLCKETHHHQSITNKKKTAKKKTVLAREQQKGFTNYVNFGTEGLCWDLLPVALKPFDYDLYRQMANKSTCFHEKIATKLCPGQNILPSLCTFLGRDRPRHNNNPAKEHGESVTTNK
jgi:hypothetical protein